MKAKTLHLDGLSVHVVFFALNIVLLIVPLVYFPYTHLQGFGQADHKVAKDILSRHYPDCTITCSNAGY